VNKFLNSNIGRLRALAFLEGISLLILVFIGVPMKYILDLPNVVKVIGPIHGMLFIGYVLITISVAGDFSWKFFSTTLKVLVASFIPFGTFYIDRKILAPAHKTVL